jgi:hypothetical protein
MTIQMKKKKKKKKKKKNHIKKQTGNGANECSFNTVFHSE